MVYRPDTPEHISEGGYGLSLKDVLRILWKRMWLIALTMFICLTAALGIAFIQTPKYEGNVKILIGQDAQGSGVPSNLAGEVEGLQQITQTMTEAVKTLPVAGAVIERLGLRVSQREFLENMTVEQVGATQFIEVSYRDTDPQRAQRIANTIGEEFADQISVLSPSANAITATVWERGLVPDAPSTPKPLRYGLIGLVLGAMLGVALAFLLAYLDDNWRASPKGK